jgi:SAM-dependent methyltransferase
VDSSSELIAIANKNLPGIDFRVQDARNLQLEPRYEAALSTFDSLNHLLTLDDLRESFAGVHRVLEPGGLFVFDMNLDEAYSADLRRWNAEVSDESVSLVRGTYDPETRKASTELIWFVRAGNNGMWQQHRSIVDQQCYSQGEILTALGEAGFQDIEAITARNAGMSADLGFGRMFFVARA